MSRTCPSLTTFSRPSISTSFPVNQPVIPPTTIRNMKFMKTPSCIRQLRSGEGIIPPPNRKNCLVNRASSDLVGARVCDLQKGLQLGSSFHHLRQDLQDLRNQLTAK